MVERVSFDGEIFAGGKDATKMDQWIAHPGDLLISKIRARQGSVGLVSETHGAVSGSIHYRSLIPDTAKVDAVFAWLTLRSEYCRTQFLAATGGAMKGEISEERLLSLNIPLPPLATQRAIVAHWREAQEKVAVATKLADEQEAAVRANFLEVLGLSDRAQGITKRAFALRWTEIERWGVEQARKSTDALDPSAGKFPVVRLGEVIADLKNGWSPKCFDRPASTDEWGVLKLGAISFGTFNETENKALPPSFTPSSALEVKTGDVLFVRGNVLRLVGACAHISATRPHLMMPDLIFRAVFRDESKIDPRYLAEVMRMPHLRHQIEAVATGTSPTMKKISKPGLLALRLPLPPIAIQKKLVAEVTAARERIAAERAAAAKLSADTAREVEEMILGHRRIYGKDER
jgi:type I restriction enzyme S subunit